MITRRNVLIRQEYHLKSGRTVVVHDIPAEEITLDGRSETDLTIAVVTRLESLVERALAQSEEAHIELTYEPMVAQVEHPANPRLSA